MNKKNELQFLYEQKKIVVKTRYAMVTTGTVPVSICRIPVPYPANRKTGHRKCGVAEYRISAFFSLPKANNIFTSFENSYCFLHAGS